jgi:aminomuconate-semialdehyde/2-hydroxymuconate-6-semialdehyde dehydrogenase
MQKILNYINGELIAPLSGSYLDNYNPSKGEVYSLIPDSDEKDIELATQSALAAFEGWSKTSIEVRSKIMLKIADLIEQNLDRLALAESIDNGKPVSLATAVDIPRAASNFRFYGTGILHFASESHSMGEAGINYTLKESIGVAGCISPWNLLRVIQWLQNHLKLLQ